MVWLTCPPISVDVRGGLVVEGMEDTQGMRFNVMEGNLMMATTTKSFGYDVLDLHSWMMHQVRDVVQVPRDKMIDLTIDLNRVG